MNILPHKSWHVRNKDNIQKVKRDEAKAAAEEQEKQKRFAIAESEARINKLRAKHSNNDDLDESNEDLDKNNSHRHVNLFEQEEQGRFNEDKNKEAELEKKVEKEKFEKKIGLLQYLSNDQIDIKSQPWIQTTRKQKYIRGDGDDADGEIDLKRKLELDPLNRMNSDLNIKKKKKKEKKKRKHRDDDDDDIVKSEPVVVDKTKSIEQLRAERLKRETEERAKAERLLNGGINNKPEQQQKVELDDRKRRYNSQFNPDLARH